jgi:hypothetical protein
MHVPHVWESKGSFFQSLLMASSHCSRHHPYTLPSRPLHPAICTEGPEVLCDLKIVISSFEFGHMQEDSSEACHTTATELVAVLKSVHAPEWSAAQKHLNKILICWPLNQAFQDSGTLLALTISHFPHAFRRGLYLPKCTQQDVLDKGNTVTYLNWTKFHQRTLSHGTLQSKAKIQHASSCSPAWTNPGCSSSQAYRPAAALAPLT